MFASSSLNITYHGPFRDFFSRVSSKRELNGQWVIFRIIQHNNSSSSSSSSFSSESSLSSPSPSSERELNRQWVIHGQPEASSGTFGTNLQILFPTSSSHPALDNHYHHYHNDGILGAEIFGKYSIPKMTSILHSFKSSSSGYFQKLKIFSKMILCKSSSSSSPLCI